MQETNLMDSEASEHRGFADTKQTEQPSTSNSTQQNMPRSELFSEVMKATVYPKKDQAIVFPAMDGIVLKDYVVAVAKLINPKNILFASRMSNNRMCMYLKSKEIVSSMVIEHGGINVGPVFIPVRRLISPSRRLVISNVPPFLPGYVIEEALKRHNVKPLSPITFVGAGLGFSDLRHIMSFRRQLYVTENETVPETLTICYEDEEYRIFLSDDKVTCYICKEVGHISSKCSKQNPTVIDNLQYKKRPPASTLENIDSIADGSVIDDEDNDTANATRAQIHMAVSDENDTPGVFFETPKRSQLAKKNNLNTRKKIKIDDGTKNPDDFEELEVLWPNDSYSLDFVQFTDFLREIKGSDNQLGVARKYTDNVELLLPIIKDASVASKARALKQRCKRLILCIKKALLAEGKQIVSPPESISESLPSLSRATSIDEVCSDLSTY